jgi:acylphosphatase
MEALHLRINGWVQGVGFRAWAVQMAARLGVRGWVRNRSDGSVEVLVIGEEPALAAMVEACRQGPRAATVQDVTIGEAEDDGSTGFAARPTA